MKTPKRLAKILETAERTYTAGEVCELLKIKPPTLRAWRLRGLLKSDKDDAKWARYTAQDIARIRKLQQRLSGHCPHCGGSLENF